MREQTGRELPAGCLDHLFGIKRRRQHFPLSS